MKMEDISEIQIQYFWQNYNLYSKSAQNNTLPETPKLTHLRRTLQYTA